MTTLELCQSAYGGTIMRHGESARRERAVLFICRSTERSRVLIDVIRPLIPEFAKEMEECGDWIIPSSICLACRMLRAMNVAVVADMMDKPSWKHQYSIQTANGFVQLVYVDCIYSDDRAVMLSTNMVICQLKRTWMPEFN